MLFVIGFFSCTEIFPQFVDTQKLAVNGEIKDIIIVHNEIRKNVEITANAAMTLVNNSENTLILVNPKLYVQSTSKIFYYYLEESKDEDVGGMNSKTYPTRSFMDKKNRKLAEKLDSKKPPKDYTITLKPKQTFTWDDSIFIVFKKTERNSFDRSLVWDTFKIFGDDFWFNFEYSLPFEISRLKPNLINELPNRWAKFGVFPVFCCCEAEGKDCEKKDFWIKTEPIFIDFSRAKVKELRNNDGK